VRRWAVLHKQCDANNRLTPLLPARWTRAVSGTRNHYVAAALVGGC